MIRYTITAPNTDNDGRLAPDGIRPMPAYADYARKLVLGRFNGATATRGRGYWRAPDGAEYSDSVTVWTIDARPEDYSTVLAIAREIAAYARQEAVYVTRQNIETELVAPLSAAA